MTIEPNEIPAGDTLVLAAKQFGDGRLEIAAVTVQGAAPACAAQIPAGSES